MPANKQDRGLMAAMGRLLGLLDAWRRRRAARRRAHLHDFIGMSDRTLADIGVRRADVHAAISGMVPVTHIARTQDGSPWTVQVHALRPQHCQRSEAFAATDLSAAA